jgi:hypothetical protein
MPATMPAPGAPPAPPEPPAPSAPLGSPIAYFTGTFGVREAERLLWRAGMGPRRGEAAELAALGLEGAVARLTRPTGAATLVGPAPHDGQGGEIHPYQQWGHDVLWWTDRMVRSSQPLIERLTLVFHDWFATSNDAVNSAQFMLEQSNLFRGHCLGSFLDLLKAVTRDRAMLVFLNGIDNARNRPNENYAREVMELFALGADRGAYTEADVREMARAFTGWRADWVESDGLVNFRFDPDRHDTGQKTVFGRTGAWNWEDACRLVVEHPQHASFFVGRLWNHFVAQPIPAAVAATLERLYVDSGWQIRPVLEAILLSPWFYDGPRLVKPPAVFVAGMLRLLGRGVETRAWAWMTDEAGQRVTSPPDVAGWDETRWLDSSTLRGRFYCAGEAMRELSLRDPDWNAFPAQTPAQAVAAARAFWGDPWLSEETVAALLDHAASCLPLNPRPYHHAQRQNLLRHMIAISPDFQTS